MLFISHNLGVIAKMCDRVGVLYAGELVEEGRAREVFNNPRHPYTVGLLRCIPRRDTLKARHALDTIPGSLPPPGIAPDGCIFADRCGLVEERCRTEDPPLYDAGPEPALAVPLPRTRPDASTRGRRLNARRFPANAPDHGGVLIKAADVSKTFHMEGETIYGLVDVTVELRAGETLGLVGESGSGKTTLARVAARPDRSRQGRRRSRWTARLFRRLRGAGRASRRRRSRSCSRTRTQR